MELDQYLSSTSLSISKFRERMRLLGHPVKNDAQIRQWRHRYGGRLPSPKNCVAIERATGGIVTRRDLRPDDWYEIWPELTASLSCTVSNVPHSLLSQHGTDKELSPTRRAHPGASDTASATPAV